MSIPTKRIKRIGLVGDLHENYTVAADVAYWATQEARADVLVLLGDAGCYRNREGRWDFLETLSNMLGRVPIVVVDGNHDDHSELRALPVNLDGSRTIIDGVTLADRGTRWTWGRTRWAAAGGAVSVDRSRMRPGVEWFSEEMLSTEETRHIIAGGPTDVLLCHDAPASAPTIARALSEPNRRIPADALADSATHRSRLDNILVATKAKRVFHGHHHRRYTDVYDHVGITRVVDGLGADWSLFDDFVMVVDTAGRPKE